LGFPGSGWGETVKADHEEVEKTAMDVQADQTGQHATIVFERPDSEGRGTGSSEPQGTHYADTDQIPAVPRQSRARRRSSGVRGLRITVAVVVVIVLLAAAALGLVKAGVVSLHSTAPPANKAPVVHTTTTLPASKPLLTQTATNGTSAAYTIPIAFYSVTVSTSTGRSWVSISAGGQRPAFEGILEPNQVHHQVLLGASTIDVGAGGTTVTVTSGKHTQVLKPPAAPFSYTITPKT
jgi:hypothetical protein